MARPREFEPEDALDRAIQVFWRKGYDATSIRDLVDHMGINRFSLYSTFGDKRSLYHAACDRYREVEVAARLDPLERSPTGLAAIQAFFAELVELLTGEGGWRGCLMTNSTVERAPHDEDTAKRAKLHLAEMDAAFYAALERARASGEIGTEQDLHECARYLTSSVQGLTVMGKVARDPGALQGIVRSVLIALK